MITVVFLLEKSEGVVRAEVQVFGKLFHVGQHLGMQFLAANAADSRILVVHGDIKQVVQLTENAELGKLGDTRKEDKLEIGIEHFYRTVKVLHRSAQRTKVIILVHHIEQWSIIFIDNDNDFFSSLLICLHHQIFQSDVGIHFFTLIAECTLTVVEHVGKITSKHIIIHMLRTTHIEMKHRMFHPFLLIFGNGKTIEQILATFVIRMYH